MKSTNKKEQATNWIREIDAEFCKLAIPRGAHALIQNGMKELEKRIGDLFHGDIGVIPPGEENEEDEP